MLLKWFWRAIHYLWVFKCTNTRTRNDTLSHFMRRHRPDVFHCQLQVMHKFLSQHDGGGVIVITTEDPGRTPTVSGASCKRCVVIQFPLRGFLRVGNSFNSWRDREFLRVFTTYPSYDLVFISVARVVGFHRVASPESWGCLTSFHEKLANAPILSSSL